MEESAHLDSTVWSWLLLILLFVLIVYILFYMRVGVGGVGGSRWWYFFRCSYHCQSISEWTGNVFRFDHKSYVSGLSCQSCQFSQTLPILANLVNPSNPCQSLQCFLAPFLIYRTHPVLYFTSQIIEKYSKVSYSTLLGWVGWINGRVGSPIQTQPTDPSDDDEEMKLLEVYKILWPKPSFSIFAQLET